MMSEGKQLALAWLVVAVLFLGATPWLGALFMRYCMWIGDVVGVPWR